MKPNPAVYPLVVVEWEDSAQPTARWQWVDEYETEDAIKCISVGYIVSESEHAVSLAPNLGDVTRDRMQASGIIRIPRSAVRDMWTLKPSRRSALCAA